MYKKDYCVLFVHYKPKDFKTPPQYIYDASRKFWTLDQTPDEYVNPHFPYTKALGITDYRFNAIPQIKGETPRKTNKL